MNFRSVTLRHRLQQLERQRAPRITMETVEGLDGRPWLRIGGGLLVPSSMTAEEWEGAARAQQASLIETLDNSRRERNRG